jgi:hypothetical protein
LGWRRRMGLRMWILGLASVLRLALVTTTMMLCCEAGMITDCWTGRKLSDLEGLRCLIDKVDLTIDDRSITGYVLLPGVSSLFKNKSKVGRR